MARVGKDGQGWARMALKAKGLKALNPWNNGKEVPRWGVAKIQKMSPSTTGRCN